MKLSSLVALVLLSGCGAKKIQANLDKCSGELTACQAALAAAQVKPAAPEEDPRLAAYRTLAEQFRDAFSGEDINIVLRDGRMVVQLPNKVLFESGKVVLSDQGKATLEKVAAVLKNHPKRRFLVAGHTDDVAVKAGARFQDNWELSALRATTAAKHLQEKGVSPTQFGAAGFGQYLPEQPNTSDAGKAANRRMEIILFPTIDELPKMPEKI